MLSERHLDRRVLQELVNYYFSIGSSNLTFDVDMKQGDLKIRARGNVLDPALIDLKDLRAKLNNGRKAEVEGYYAELIGNLAHTADVVLLGDLIDYADVDLRDNVLHISLYREL